MWTDHDPRLYLQLHIFHEVPSAYIWYNLQISTEKKGKKFINIINIIIVLLLKLIKHIYFTKLIEFDRRISKVL